MCGIAGLFNARSNFSSVEEMGSVVASMTRALIHRGPDVEGIWSDPHGRCVLGSRRLSVIDLSDAGRQPMLSDDGKHVIAYNGEIYNFEELRPRLRASGIAFRGHADTEVLVNCLALWGTDALEQLDGMFAFAAFDKTSGDLLLARDPFGEKPLYYLELPAGGLAFASELQAFERLPQFDGQVDTDAVAELLMFEYVGAPRSIYRSVRKLPPGRWMRVSPGRPLQVQRYFEFRPGVGEPDDRPLDQLADELEGILERSLRRRIVSDVPLGAFLSGGVDSSTVCAIIARRLGLHLKTFSIGFAGAPESEHEAAQLFARHLGVEHHEKLLVPGDMAALANLGKFLDEPNSDWSCLPVYMLSKLAREQVTVAVSGDGGDEMFGGYTRYADTLGKELEGRASPGESYYNWGLLALDEKALVQFLGLAELPPAVATRLRTLRDEMGRPSTSLLDRMRKSDVDNYLPGAVLAKVDRMSMQHSLEVRTPFLSVEMARFAERLPQSALCGPGWSKRVLREVAYRYLPRALVDRPKVGFGLPNLEWARDEIRSVAQQLLGSGDSRLREFVGGEPIDILLGRPKATHRLWALAMLESWLRHHRAKLSRTAMPVH